MVKDQNPSHNHQIRTSKIWVLQFDNIDGSKYYSGIQTKNSSTNKKNMDQMSIMTGDKKVCR